MTRQFDCFVQIQKIARPLILNGTYSLTFIAALFTLAKIWKQPKCPPVDERIKTTHTHAHAHTMEYYLDITKNEIVSFTTKWMDLENIILSEINQTEKEKCYIILLACGI